MPTTFQRGAFVKYEGSIQRFRNTWWTITAVNRSRTGRIVDYTLETKGIGRLHHVSPAHINQNRDGEAC